MKKLLNIPLLPENKVSGVFISGEYPEINQALKDKYGITSVIVNQNRNLAPEISSHADCMMVQMNKNSFIIESGNSDHFVNYLTKIKGELNSDFNVIQSREKIQSPYPGDVCLNVKVMGNSVIGNKKYISSDILEFCNNHNMRIIHTNQGYSACSTIILNDNALITDDESIFTSSGINGIDCILISKGSVKLKGHNYGFIGGTCGMINKNLIAFTGKLSTHTDSDIIINFLDKHNIDFVELTDGPLIDIGGIIPITEEC